MAGRWRRIEPGYYELVGTHWSIANMAGQSVRYGGLIVNPWHARYATIKAAEFRTKRQAQEYVNRAKDQPDRDG